MEIIAAAWQSIVPSHDGIANRNMIVPVGRAGICRVRHPELMPHFVYQNADFVDSHARCLVTGDTGACASPASATRTGSGVLQ